MANLKVKDLQAKTEKELTDLINEQRTKLSQLMVDSRTKKISNVKEFSHLKKSIARALTLLRARELEKEQTND